MDISSLDIEPMSELKLGPQGVAAVAAGLHGGLCVACSQPMTGRPSLVVDVYGHGLCGYASLHHSRCSTPQWRIADDAPDQLTTCSVSYLLIANDNTTRAVMVFNPMLESVFVVPDGDGQWFPSLHPQYAQAGMTRAHPDWLPPFAPGIHAAITGTTLCITEPSGRTVPGPAIAVPGDILDAARQHGNVLLAVTQAIDPQLLEGDHASLLRLVFHPLTLVGLVALTEATAPAPH